MKEFIGTFAVCLTLIIVFLFLGGAILFENIWALIIFTAFVTAVLISVLVSQDSRIEELEKRIEELEKEKRE